MVNGHVVQIGVWPLAVNVILNLSINNAIGRQR